MKAPSGRTRRGPRIGSILAMLALVCCALSSAPKAQPAYDAAFVSQTVPSFIELLSPTLISVTMRNTGAATWYRVEGDVFLATQEPQDNYYWCLQDNPYGSHSGNRALLPNDVAPGQGVTFSFVVKPLGCRFSAPAPLRFRMLSQRYGTFGEETPDPEVAVSTATEFVAQQVPATVPSGATVLVTETFKNTTPVTWQTTDGYTLRSAGPAGNTTWGVNPVPLPATVAPGATVTFTFYIAVPATVGTYNFQWQMSTPDGVPFGGVSPATSVQVIAPGPPNYQGLWWNAPAGSEAGWGINFAHQGDIIFATWFTYDMAGKALWLTMTAPLVSTGVYTGTLFEATGPPFDAVPFDPAQVFGVVVGTGTLTFTDPNTGTFAYTVNGVTQTKPITREVFAQLPTCTFGIQTDLTLAYNYQDLWWAAPAGAEAGWGVNLTHQGDTIFATWFTFDLDRTAVWFVVTAPKTAAGVYSGTLYRTTGPPFNAAPFDPAQIRGTVVGTATFTFSDGNTGTFNYTVNDVTQTKAITREIFVAPGTVCQ
ncbi:MAG: NBR1-Ig-like domain-containing protein [Casimicrobiaceae bacterium]